MLTFRLLSRTEIEHVWSIDRSEVINHIYYLENGSLVLRPEHYDLHGWPPGEAEHYTSLLLECIDHGGWCWGGFDDARLVGVAILESSCTSRPPHRRTRSTSTCG